MPGIFISYRREDSIVFAGRICDRLTSHFGRQSVFMDVDSIPFGVDFRQHLTDAVSQCDVFLALIGEQWLNVSQSGQRRLDDPRDFVRIEIEVALQRDIPVIPVLLGKAAMPREDELPAAIGSLVYRNAAQVDAGKDFHNHLDRLIRGMEQLAKIGSVSTHPLPKQPDVENLEGRPETLDKAAPNESGQSRNSDRSSSSSLDELKRQFVDEIKLRAYDDKYLDCNEEREIIQVALAQGITVDSARASLVMVCDSNGYVLESQVLTRVKELVEQLAANDGTIDQKDFSSAVAVCMKGTQGKKNDRGVKKLVIKVIEDNGFKAKQGMFNRWYDAVKKEVGLA